MGLHVLAYIHRNPFRGFGAPGGQNLAFPITLAICFYNSLYYRTSRDTYFWLFALSQNKTNSNRNTTVNLPTTSGKYHHTTTWTAELAHLNLTECCWLWKEPVVMCGNLNARQQRHSKCSKWPPSAWTRASSLFRRGSIASSTTLCWNSVHVSTSRWRNSSASPTGTQYTRSCVKILMPQMR